MVKEVSELRLQLIRVIVLIIQIFADSTTPVLTNSHFNYMLPLHSSTPKPPEISYRTPVSPRFCLESGLWTDERLMSKLGAIQTTITSVAILSAVAITSIVGLKIAKAEAANSVYQDRIRDLSTNYESLAAQYNQAVRQTAVTELVVKDRKITVQIRTIEGEQETIQTPCNADKEIYGDFALIAGRLWIRRVFDADTPPSQATVINPKLANVDWDSEGALVGQAVYRQLDEGRWIVNAAGDGALALTKVPDDQIINLSPPPTVKAYEEIQSEVNERIDKVTWRDVFASVFTD